MRREHWHDLWRRLDAVWPTTGDPSARRDLYFEVLEDLEDWTVTAAVEALVREDREYLPPVGVVRTRAVAMNPAATAPPPAPRLPPSRVPVTAPAPVGAPPPPPPSPPVVGSGTVLPRVSRRAARQWLNPLLMAAIVLASLGVVLVAVGAFSATRPEVRCERALAVVDRTGEPIQGENRCLTTVRRLGPLTTAWSSYYLGGAAACLVGAGILTYGWRRPRWLAQS